MAVVAWLNATSSGGGGGSNIKLVSVGSIVSSTTSTITPNFGQSTTAGNLLVCWLGGGAGGSSSSFSTSASGWTQAVSASVSFVDAGALYYKADCAAGETAPTFNLNLVSPAYALLGEFSGLATSSPLDQYGLGVSNEKATGNNPDTTSPDLLIAVQYVNNGVSGSSSATTMTDGTGSSLTTTTYNTGTSTPYFYCWWGVTTGTGTSDDTAATSGLPGSYMTLLSSFKHS